MPITRLTASRVTAMPTWSSAARTQRFTPSSSLTVVPAMSKTTSSIVHRITCPLEVSHDFFGQAERQRHAGSAHARDDRRARRRMGDEIRIARMLGIDAVPAGGNFELGHVEKRVQVIENQPVDLGLVERLDVGVVFVRIADHQLSVAVLRRHHVDAVAIELGRFAGDALL